MKVVLILAVLAFANLIQAESGEISYSFTLWIGDKIENKYSIDLKSPSGIYFIEAMQQAEGLDSNFAFDRFDYPFGSFITSIGAYTNDG